MDRVDWGTRKRVHMQIYRALDFFTSLGVVHKVASLSAYVLCRRPSPACRCHFLICDQCHWVTEVLDSGLQRSAETTANANGFASAQAIEVHGLCGSCQSIDPASA